LPKSKYDANGKTASAKRSKAPPLADGYLWVVFAFCDKLPEGIQMRRAKTCFWMRTEAAAATALIHLLEAKGVRFKTKRGEPIISKHKASEAERAKRGADKKRQAIQLADRDARHRAEMVLALARRG